VLEPGVLRSALRGFLEAESGDHEIVKTGRFAVDRRTHFQK